MGISGPDDSSFPWPNDLRFGANGYLYLTHSGILDVDFMSGLAMRLDWRRAPYVGRVYEIDPAEGRVVRSFGEDVKFTNGLAFGANGVLFVAETVTGAIFRLDASARSPAFEPSGRRLSHTTPLTCAGRTGLRSVATAGCAVPSTAVKTW